MAHLAHFWTWSTSFLGSLAEIEGWTGTGAGGARDGTGAGAGAVCAVLLLWGGVGVAWFLDVPTWTFVDHCEAVDAGGGGARDGADACEGGGVGAGGKLVRVEAGVTGVKLRLSDGSMTLGGGAPISATSETGEIAPSGVSGAPSGPMNMTLFLGRSMWSGLLARPPEPAVRAVLPDPPESPESPEPRLAVEGLPELLLSEESLRLGSVGSSFQGATSRSPGVAAVDQCSRSTPPWVAAMDQLSEGGARDMAGRLGGEVAEVTVESVGDVIVMMGGGRGPELDVRREPCDT